MYTECGNPIKKKGVTNVATVESNERWKKENTVFVGLRLMKKTDMDIIEALGDDPRKQPRMRDLLRKGVAYEQTHSTAQATDPKTEQYIRLGKEYEKMLAAGWKLTPPHEEKAEEPKAGPALKNDYGFERTASGLPDLRKVKRWNQEENNEEEKEK